jgi:hypothetical protein
MKKYLLVHLLVFSAMFNLAAQSIDFAPVGAKWYYNELNFALKIIPHVIESVAKENYQGKLCNKLLSSSDDIVPNPAYVYTENDTVYYFSASTNQFEMLYDFTAEVGDQWTIGGLPAVIPDHPLPYASDTITVDSISSMVLGGDTLKVWHISNSFWFEWGGRIIEKIGNDQLFMPKFGLIEAYVWGLRCFESPSEAYHLVPYPCDTTYSTISTTSDPFGSDGIVVGPNPFHEKITLTSESFSESLTFLLFDNVGNLVRHQHFSGSVAIETTSLPPGIYFWSVEMRGTLLKRGRCVKG